MPYQPMARPICTTTPEQMNEKLQRRVRDAKEKVHVQPQPIDGRDQPRADELAWLEPSIDPETGRKRCFVLSQCGRYSVDAARMSGSQFRFSAWRRVTTSGELPLALGCRDTSSEAKALCEAHLASQRVTP